MGCRVDTRLHPYTGLCNPIRPPRDLILHLPSGRCVAPKEGRVYGVRGTPIGGICADGYVRLGQHAVGELYEHRFIYECVHGSIPAGHYIDHKNGCKSDNRIANLEAVTPSENMLRAFERGACQVGEQVSQSKLTVALVREIRRTARTVPPRDWAARLGVHPRTIREARDGTTWRHVPMRGRIPARPRWRRP